jgi:hypothetical protein
MNNMGHKDTSEEHMPLSCRSFQTGNDNFFYDQLHNAKVVKAVPKPETMFYGSSELS